MAKTKSFTKNWLSVWTSDLNESYPIKGYPSFCLINKEGEIVATWFGVREKKLTKVIEKAVGRE